VREHLPVTGFRTLERIVFGRKETVAGTVYGTIVVMATLAAGSRGAETDAWQLATAAAVTVLVLWLAHVYSHSLAESLQRGRSLDPTEFGSVARRQLAIPLAAVAPVGSLVLAALGILGERIAIWLALGFGVAALAVQGARYAALERLAGLATAVSIGLNVCLGLAIVVLEVLIAH
jgi:hypothetical protein